MRFEMAYPYEGASQTESSTSKSTEPRMRSLLITAPPFLLRTTLPAVLCLSQYFYCTSHTTTDQVLLSDPVQV